MTFDPGNQRAHVEEVWRILSPAYLIQTNQTCGRHVHISPPGNEEWGIESLKSICRSIQYFETAFEVIVPRARRSNEYAKNNWAKNPKLRCKTRVQCFRLVVQCSNNIDIMNLMNHDGDRYYGWNFMNLVYGGTMIIEFHRGPGVTEAEQCLSWVEVAVTFIRAAKSVGTPAIWRNVAQTYMGSENSSVQASKGE
jgi:Putative amidoligase enzyme